MTVEERLTTGKDLFAECIKTFEKKGEAYAKTQDAMSNFKYSRIGQTKYQVWFNYFDKHCQSIATAIELNPVNPVDKSEGLHSRIVDGINYLMLLECLLKEFEK